jgi:hypothetical protein
MRHLINSHALADPADPADRLGDLGSLTLT